MSSVIDSVDKKEKMEGSFVIVSPHGSPKKTPRRSALRPAFPIDVSHRRSVIRRRGHPRTLSADAADGRMRVESPAILSIRADSDCLDDLSDDFSDSRESSIASVHLPPPAIPEVVPKPAPAILFSSGLSSPPVPHPLAPSTVLPSEHIPAPPPAPIPAPDLEPVPLIWSSGVRYPSAKEESEAIARMPEASVTPAHVTRFAVLNGF